MNTLKKHKGFLISLCIAILFVYKSWLGPASELLPFFYCTMFGMSALLPLVWILYYRSYRANAIEIETKMVPKATSILVNSLEFTDTKRLDLLYPLFSFFFAIGLTMGEQSWIFYLSSGILWLLITGHEIDRLLSVKYYIGPFLSPDLLIGIHSDNACIEAEFNDISGLESSISALCEAASIAIHKKRPQFAKSSIQAISPAMNEFFSSVNVEDEEEIHTILFSLFSQLEMLNNFALDARMDPVNEAITSLLGKTALYAFDHSQKGHLPLHYIYQFSKEMRSRGFYDLEERTNCALIEVLKLMVSEVKAAHIDIKSPFISAIKHLEEAALEDFKRDKKAKRIPILLRPFLEIKKLCESLSDHPDAKVINGRIDDVIDQFSALAAVIQRPVPAPAKTKKVPKKKDTTEETGK
jgi:hypothetical protein